ncbi:MAG: hypothetical protein KVP17_001611 [Porospora cf. gigantea B]|uniref:uncharacterized protein n=1 Tax=Porospora cf. gigantea B TaxID=2853592 RepID=UPI003571F5D2|nr:MAG: hypothetical protein KVP17_001611 [Porospora cf. gigantea B]
MADLELNSTSVLEFVKCAKRGGAELVARTIKEMDKQVSQLDQELLQAVQSRRADIVQSLMETERLLQDYIAVEQSVQAAFSQSYLLKELLHDQPLLKAAEAEELAAERRLSLLDECTSLRFDQEILEGSFDRMAPLRDARTCMAVLDLYERTQTGQVNNVAFMHQTVETACEWRALTVREARRVVTQTTPSSSLSVAVDVLHKIGELSDAVEEVRMAMRRNVSLKDRKGAMLVQVRDWTDMITVFTQKSLALDAILPPDVEFITPQLLADALAGICDLLRPWREEVLKAAAQPVPLNELPVVEAVGEIGGQLEKADTKIRKVGLFSVKVVACSLYDVQALRLGYHTCSDPLKSSLLSFSTAHEPQFSSLRSPLTTPILDIRALFLTRAQTRFESLLDILFPDPTEGVITLPTASDTKQFIRRVLAFLKRRFISEIPVCLAILDAIRCRLLATRSALQHREASRFEELVQLTFDQAIVADVDPEWNERLVSFCHAIVA